MPISTPMMIGAAILVLVVIIIIAVVATSDNNVEGEVIVDVDVDDDDDDNGVTCSTFDGCPDDMEIIPDANGESESECCQKKTCESNGVQCKTTACSSPEGCWDQLTDDRGDSEEECCVKALCSDDLCEPGFKLKEGNLSGRSNSDCCDPKPLCSTEVECPADHIPKAGGPRGDSVGDCCLMKKCSDNGWDEAKCLDSGKAVGDPNERGNTADLCCVTRSCHDNGYDAGNSTKCPDGLTGVDDDNIIGDNKEDCCVAGKCQDNGWDAAKCSLMSSLSKPHLKINEPRGDSVGECCQEKLCSDYYFDGDSCRGREGGPDDVGDWTGDAQVCFTVDNQYPGQEGEDVMSRKLKTNCAYDDNDDRPTKLVSGAVRIPGSGSTQDAQKSTCCIPKTCGELNSDNSIQCGAGSTFVPEQTVDNDGSLKDKCCTVSKCPDDYKSDQDCETAFGELGEFYELNNGVDGWAELDSTKEKCCKPKKCIDVFSDAKCAADNEARPKFNQPSANDEIIVDSTTLAETPEYAGKKGGNCCTALKCNEMDYSCPEEMVLKEDQPALEANHTNCCEYKLCSDPTIGWTDEKCRSKDYTRASVRGKLKTNGTVTGASQKPTLEPGSGYLGDKNCCEKDPSSYARMCVGNDWFSGQVVNKSIGASIHDHQGVALSTTSVSPSACKGLCDANPSCSTFISTNGGGVTSMGTETNPKCELYRKIGNEVNVPDIIGGEHMHKKIRVQYVKGGNFPENHRYSGGIGAVSELDGGLTADSGSTGAARDVKERKDATKIAYADADDEVKGRGIFVAGIDNEFCPFDQLKIYGNHSDAAGRLAGTWYPDGTSTQAIAAGNKIGGSGGACESGYVNNILEDCYRNRHCGAEWISQQGGKDHHRSITYDDAVTSQIGKLKMGPALAVNRSRHCSKGVYGGAQKASGKKPVHNALGGAYMTPTRKILEDEENVQYGVVNDKHTWPGSGGYDKWDGLLLPGDTHLPD